jgi:hypothetical protein
MIVCIMQPTYLPWIGYFDLIDQSDAFVVLDTVAFSRQSWQQRNRIAAPQGPIWLTVPVRRVPDQPIGEVEIDNGRPWRRKHWASIEMNYRRAPHWDSCAPALAPVYEREWMRLAELNLALIHCLCELSGVKGSFVLASQMPEAAGAREQRLVDICRALGADTYLSPLGALDYLQTSTGFAEAGIELRFQAYEHPTYPQATASFASHLSFLDALVNLGPSSASVMRAGRRPAMTLTEAQAHSS